MSKVGMTLTFKFLKCLLVMQRGGVHATDGGQAADAEVVTEHRKHIVPV